MARHHALRPTGGAGGEDQIRQMLTAHEALASFEQSGVGGVGAGGKRRPARQVDGLAQIGESHRRVAEHRSVVGAEEAVGGEQHRRAASFEHVGGFGSLEAGVDRDDRATRALRPEGGEDPLGRVGCPDGHPLAELESGREERPRGAMNLGDQLGPGPTTITDHQSLAGSTGGRANDGRDRVHAYFRCVMPSILIALPRSTLYICSSVRSIVCSWAILAVWGQVESECG